jgi:prevent-host-death family protein
MSEAIKVGVRELRAGLSRYLQKASHGEEVVVLSRGSPVARLVAAEADLGAPDPIAPKDHPQP